MGTSSALMLGVRLLKSSVNSLNRSISPGLPHVDHLIVVTAPPAWAGACAAPAVVGWAAAPAAAVGLAADCPPPPAPHAASVTPARPAAAATTNFRRLMNCKSSFFVLIGPS